MSNQSKWSRNRIFKFWSVTFLKPRSLIDLNSKKFNVWSFGQINWSNKSVADQLFKRKAQSIWKCSRAKGMFESIVSIFFVTSATKISYLKSLKTTSDLNIKPHCYSLLFKWWRSSVIHSLPATHQVQNHYKNKARQPRQL